MIELPFDCVADICLFLNTRNMLTLSMTSRQLYSKILNSKVIMIKKPFTVRSNILNLDFMKNLSYKIFNLNIFHNKSITDKAFEYLKGIHTIDMSRCNQNTITDKAFKNLKGIHTLHMKSCNQDTITDKAFQNLRGIHTL